MKTKEEILKMNKEELKKYKSILKSKDCSDCYNCYNCSDCSDCYNCSDCFDCSYCSDCFDCFYCFDCSYCKGLKDDKIHQYKICNIQLTKEEYEKKIKELQEKK